MRRLPSGRYQARLTDAREERHTAPITFASSARPRTGWPRSGLTVCAARGMAAVERHPEEGAAVHIVVYDADPLADLTVPARPARVLLCGQVVR